MVVVAKLGVRIDLQHWYALRDHHDANGTRVWAGGPRSRRYAVVGLGAVAVHRPIRGVHRCAVEGSGFRLGRGDHELDDRDHPVRPSCPPACPSAPLVATERRPLCRIRDWPETSVTTRTRTRSGGRRVDVIAALHNKRLKVAARVGY